MQHIAAAGHRKRVGASANHQAGHLATLVAQRSTMLAGGNGHEWLQQTVDETDRAAGHDGDGAAQQPLDIAKQLVKEEPIDPKYRLHKLTGNFKDRWECHIEPDWLLIYYKTKTEIVFERTGTHSDLFN